MYYTKIKLEWPATIYIYILTQKRVRLRWYSLYNMSGQYWSIGIIRAR